MQCNPWAVGWSSEGRPTF